MAWLARRSFARLVVPTSVTYLETVRINRPDVAVLSILHRLISELLET